MNALVLGGTRFIGLRLVRELARQGHQITLLNRGRTQADLPAGIERLYADRRDGDAIKKALAGKSYDAVFDFTGYQTRGLEPVVEVLDGKIGRYLFQSTTGVYADGDLLPTTEQSPTLPPVTSSSGLGAYEVEKVQCENFLLQACRERGFPATILRSPVIYGPENWMHDREFSFFSRLRQALPVLVPGNGNTFLPFAHVDDVGQAHLAAVASPAAVGQIYNIAGSSSITINGYLDIIAGLMGVEWRKIYLDLSVMKTLKPCVFPFRWAKSAYFSIAKAEQQMAWQPRFDIAGGLRQTYEWWQRTLGVEKTVFTPGRLGNDVDLAYEAELVKQYA